MPAEALDHLTRQLEPAPGARRSAYAPNRLPTSFKSSARSHAVLHPSERTILAGGVSEYPRGRRERVALFCDDGRPNHSASVNCAQRGRLNIDAFNFPLLPSVS
jgi:hypothetical protein